MPVRKWLAALRKRRRETGDDRFAECPATAPGDDGHSQALAVESVQSRSTIAYDVVAGRIALPREFRRRPIGGIHQSAIRDARDVVFALGFILLAMLALLPLAPYDIRRVVEDKTGIEFRRTAAEPAERYFSLGATEQEVLQIQGQPTAIRGNTWFYGRSQVHFRGGRVTGWISSSDRPLRTPVPAMI